MRMLVFQKPQLLKKVRKALHRRHQSRANAFSLSVPLCLCGKKQNENFCNFSVGNSGLFAFLDMTQKALTRILQHIQNQFETRLSPIIGIRHLFICIPLTKGCH